ncbi:MAG: hypothetical protein ACMG6E_10490 [Candidatus Roizmanbacteria bacterium]
MNPFNQTETNDILGNVSAPEKNVEGLIFITNDIITSDEEYTRPQIISIATEAEGAMI